MKRKRTILKVCTISLLVVVGMVAFVFTCNEWVLTLLLASTGKTKKLESIRQITPEGASLNVRISDVTRAWNLKTQSNESIWHPDFDKDVTVVIHNKSQSALLIHSVFVQDWEAAGMEIEPDQQITLFTGKLRGFIAEYHITPDGEDRFYSHMPHLVFHSDEDKNMVNFDIIFKSAAPIHLSSPLEFKAILPPDTL